MLATNRRRILGLHCFDMTPIYYLSIIKEEIVRFLFLLERLCRFNFFLKLFSYRFSVRDDREPVSFVMKKGDYIQQTKYLILFST